jgi:hypothetical protein
MPVLWSACWSRADAFYHGILGIEETCGGDPKEL